MITKHVIHLADSRENLIFKDNIDLVVTSPPYPMINIWDDLFSKMNPEIKNALVDEDGEKAFELMHRELDKVWLNLYNAVKDGGIVCINIGDATRKMGDDFQIYPNHTRIIQYMRSIGFRVLPWIIWRKPTNSPTKFMGSGMLPPSAYVTLEHEFILIFRKGGKRIFTDSEREMRRKSAYFWNERNIWFSDVWSDIYGVSQKIDTSSRSRSAAFPLELAYRLIQMYSIYGDTVIDPFLGTGTTMIASIISGRNSIGIEIDPELIQLSRSRIKGSLSYAREIIEERLSAYKKFSKNLDKAKAYYNKNLGLYVKTKQETDIAFYVPTDMKESSNEFIVSYILLNEFK